MTLLLTKLSTAEALDMLEKKRAGLEKTVNGRPPEDAAPAQLEKFNHFFGNKSYEYGVCLYQQQGDRVEIRKHLQNAGQALLKTHELREPPEPNATRNPWAFLKALNLSVVFCSSEMRKLAASIGEHTYRYPPRTDNKTITDYLGLVKVYLANGGIDQDIIADVTRASSAESASKDLSTWILPAVLGLKSLIDEDAIGLNLAIDSLVKNHKREALTGELKRTPDGNICLPGLMLAKLGFERKLMCTVESDYLPLNLFEGKQ